MCAGVRAVGSTKAGTVLGAERSIERETWGDWTGARVCVCSPRTSPTTGAGIKAQGVSEFRRI